MYRTDESGGSPTSRYLTTSGGYYEYHLSRKSDNAIDFYDQAEGDQAVAVGVYTGSIRAYINGVRYGREEDNDKITVTSLGNNGTTMNGIFSATLTEMGGSKIVSITEGSFANVPIIKR